MSQVKAALVTACLCGGLAAPAFAAKTVVVEVTLDTAALQFGGNSLEFTAYAVEGFSPPFESFELAEGDSLDLTIDFAGDQTITINGLDTIWAYTFAKEGVTDVASFGKFQFLNADGTVLRESTEKSSEEGSIHFGQQFFTDDFPDSPSSITFSGVRYVGTLVDYAELGITSRIYDKAGFSFDGATFTTAVPEPGTWALMLAGIGLLGAAAARRRG